MLSPSCGLCPGITAMLRGTAARLRQHETHGLIVGGVGGGSTNTLAEASPADE